MSNEPTSDKPMKKDSKTIALFATIALLAGVIIGYASSHHDDGFMGMHHGDQTSNGMMGNNPKPNPTGVSGPDVMFFQMMIPHHQQAIDMSNLALKTSKNAELVALAQKIIAAQTAEITQMKLWLTDAGESTEVPDHMGHGMGGMLTDAEFADLAKATGSEFDKLWLQGMIGHHEGAIHMVTMIDNSPNATSKKFGEDVTTAQSAEITQMKAMLAKLG